MLFGFVIALAAGHVLLIMAKWLFTGSIAIILIVRLLFLLFLVFGGHVNSVAEKFCDIWVGNFVFYGH